MLRRPPLPERDLRLFAEAMEELPPALSGKRIFVTGGTGFFGIWMVECLLFLHRQAGLSVSLTLLTRDPDRFRQKVPHLAGDLAVQMVQGDVRSFPFPPGHYDYVVHAAADSVVAPGTPEADEFATIVDGTERVLAFARGAGAERLLFVSSGAVYGPQPPTLPRLCEQSAFAEGAGAYAEGKRAAEELCLAQTAVHCTIVRAFAFIGPHLPLGAHFAAGNFLADALSGRPINIHGDGTPLRSYLYAADLAIWLWTLLLRGERARAYNVGSEEAVSIRQLGQLTASIVCPGLEVRVLGAPAAEGALPARYVPSTARARTELGLRQSVGLEEAIRRTAEWYRSAREPVNRPDV